MTHIRNSHYSGETDQIIWFSGTNEITVVDLQDMKMTEIKNFLPSMGPGKDAIPLRAVMKDNGRTILVSFAVDNSFGLAYHNKTLREPDPYVLNALLPRCKLSQSYPFS